MGLKPAIFLDRDGVLCENRPDYIKNETELRLFPWTTLAMRTLAQLDAYIFVFTNQSAVGRGILSIGEANNINNRLKYVVELGGGRIDDIFMCPHSPQEGCDCRKPEPGMLFQAFGKYPDIDTGKLAIIGDSMTDFVCIPDVDTTNCLVQSGVTKRMPTRWQSVHSFPPSILEAAYQIKKWLNVHNSNTTAKTAVYT